MSRENRRRNQNRKKDVEIVGPLTTGINKVTQKLYEAQEATKPKTVIEQWTTWWSWMMFGGGLFLGLLAGLYAPGRPWVYGVAAFAAILMIGSVIQIRGLRSEMELAIIDAKKRARGKAMDEFTVARRKERNAP